MFSGLMVFPDDKIQFWLSYFEFGNAIILQAEVWTFFAPYYCTVRGIGLALQKVLFVLLNHANPKYFIHIYVVETHRYWISYSDQIEVTSVSISSSEKRPVCYVNASSKALSLSPSSSYRSRLLSFTRPSAASQQTVFSYWSTNILKNEFKMILNLKAIQIWSEIICCYFHTLANGLLFTKNAGGRRFFSSFLMVPGASLCLLARYAWFRLAIILPDLNIVFSRVAFSCAKPQHLCQVISSFSSCANLSSEISYTS